MHGTIAAGEAPDRPPRTAAAPARSPGRLRPLGARPAPPQPRSSQRRRPAGRPRAPALRRRRQPWQLRPEHGPPGEAKFAHTWDRAPRTAPAAPRPARPHGRNCPAGPPGAKAPPGGAPTDPPLPPLPFPFPSPPGSAPGAGRRARCLPCAACWAGSAGGSPPRRRALPPLTARRPLRARRPPARSERRRNGCARHEAARPRGGPGGGGGGWARPLPWPRPPPAARGRGGRGAGAWLRAAPCHAAWAPAALWRAPRGKQRARPSAAPLWPVRVAAGPGAAPSGERGDGGMDGWMARGDGGMDGWRVPGAEWLHRHSHVPREAAWTALLLVLEPHGALASRNEASLTRSKLHTFQKQFTFRESCSTPRE